MLNSAITREKLCLISLILARDPSTEALQLLLLSSSFKRPVDSMQVQPVPRKYSSTRGSGFDAFPGLFGVGCAIVALPRKGDDSNLCACLTHMAYHEYNVRLEALNGMEEHLSVRTGRQFGH